MLTTLERFPTAVFRESALRQLFPHDFERARRQGIITRLPLESGVRSLTRGNRRLMLIPEGAAYVGVDEEDTDATVEEIGHEELAVWHVRMDVICSQFRERNELAGASGSLHGRLYLLGETSPDRAVILALLADERSALALLKAIPSLVSGSYAEVLVVRPSFRTPPAERRALESMGIGAEVMDDRDPFLLPPWPSLRGRDSLAQDAFDHSHDYRWVRVGALDFTLTESQATVVKVLHRAFLSSRPDVQWRTIDSNLESSPGKMSDVFKGLRGWQNVVVSKKRGTYRLNL